jgi:pimeloyl-ACP methyl ester carboxylesterase
MQSIELTIDVTEAVNLGISAHTAATVYLPDEPVTERPIVCFAFPGGGYNRRYYALDLANELGGQAAYHTSRGWIFVSCDHLGVGDSTVPEGNVLSYEHVANANLATVNAVMEKLQQGNLAESIAPITDAVKIGIGQSMGGCFTVVLQGQHAPFDGIATLGYSAIHTVVPAAPGKPQPQWPWMVRGSDPEQPLIVNQAAMAKAEQAVTGEEDLQAADGEQEHPFAWSFHYDDVPAELVAVDLHGKNADGSLPYWRSATTPSCAIQMVSPGTVAPEAAVITVPVLVVAGERDVVPEPKREPQAFQSANDVSVFVCPRMGHMHNFASSRQLLWSRLHYWGSGVAEACALTAG